MTRQGLKRMLVKRCTGVRSIRVNSPSPGPGDGVMKLSTGGKACSLECTALMSQLR